MVFLVLAVGSLAMLILGRREMIELFKASISKGHERNGRDTLTRIFAWVVGFGAVFAVVWLLPRVNMGDFSTSIGPATEQSASGVPQLPSPSEVFVPSALPPGLLLVPAVVLVAVAFVGGLVLFQAVREIKEESAEVPLQEEVMQKEALSAVKQAISSIMIKEGDSDFRVAIIRCYRRLCELLADRNCQIKRHETVQEFKVSASGCLSIPDGPFSALTNLFEEARYSLHEISESERSAALKCLGEIEDHLTGDR
jgi:hypothetical protein